MDYLQFKHEIINCCFKLKSKHVKCTSVVREGLILLSCHLIRLYYLTHATLHIVKQQCVCGDSNGRHGHHCTQLDLHHRATSDL